MSNIMGNQKIGFVILHYNHIEVTIKCVDSILGLEKSDRIEIVIVDNNSTNDSGKRLKEYYSDKRVKVIILDRNYGFSKANNVGYDYLIKNTSCKFIIIANNDILFIQKDMIKLLEEQYEKREFYVAGPDVFSLYKNQHQSPLAVAPRTEKDTLKLIAINQNKLRHVRRETFLHWLWLKVNKTKIYEIYRNKTIEHREEKIVKWEEEQDNIVLHGSCLFFSEKFLELNVYPFQPETFFYYEEDILADRCLKCNWKISYIPKIHVNHLEGASTGQKGYYKKMTFRYTNIINSGKVYLKYLRGEK
ncbi:glycosyltransferase [Mordavella massiliensis]|uniref:glycosyltransferase n=1 Tax=Mordavella massiliensis TaxID=1871024 RepID=UPI00210C6D52|nr:glycosyltransferase [Mordavella massiliensis]